MSQEDVSRFTDKPREILKTQHYSVLRQIVAHPTSPINATTINHLNQSSKRVFTEDALSLLSQE